MKAQLTFDLNEPEDISAHKRCILAVDMAVAIWNISNLRKDLEWQEEQGKLTSEYVMDAIFQALQGLPIDDLMN